MELRHFRYFAAVARYLNYSEASRRLHVAQPAISQTILDLEEEIGAKVFLRSNRKVQLTAAGTALLGEVEGILKRTDEATRVAQRAARGEVGMLRIGFIAPATAPILPPLVQTYLRQYPSVELQLHHMNPDTQFAAFDEGTLDLGLSRPLPPERRPYFEEEVIYNDYLGAVLPPKHPLGKETKIRLETLAAEPFVLFHRVGAPGLFDEAVAMCVRAWLFAQSSTRARSDDHRFPFGGKRAWCLVSTGLRPRLGTAEDHTPTIGGAIQSHMSLCHLATWISQPNS